MTFRKKSKEGAAQSDRRAAARNEAKATARDEMKAAAPPRQSGRYAYEGLDRIMHEKARLGILTSLSTHREGLLFNQMKDFCSLSDGNLSRHIQALEEAGLVEVWKGFHKKKPQTLCRITPAGLERFQEYLQELEKVIRDAAEAEIDPSVPAKIGSQRLALA